MGGISINVREGMRRLGIVLGVLGCVIGVGYSYFLGEQVRESARQGVLKESLLMDYGILLALPIVGFLIPWGSVRMINWLISFLRLTRLRPYPRTCARHIFANSVNASGFL
jgi:hypothetical protein